MSELKTNLYNAEEVHPNCTVIIWRNLTTGEMSIGWYENENPPVVIDRTKDEGS